MIGFNEACRQVRRHADNFTRQMWKEFQVLRPELSRNQLVVQPQYFGACNVAIEVVFGPAAPRQLRLVVKSRRIDEFRDWHVEHAVSVTSASRDPLVIKADSTRIYNLSIIGVSPDQADQVLIRARHRDGSAGAASIVAGEKSASRLSLRNRLALLRDAFS